MAKGFVGVLAVAVAMPLVVDTNTETVNGVKWEYVVNNGLAEVVKVRKVESDEEALSGVWGIPSTLGGYTVSKI